MMIAQIQKMNMAWQSPLVAMMRYAFFSQTVCCLFLNPLLILPQLSACRQDQDDFDESADEDEYDDYDDDIEDEEIDKY